MDNTWLLIDVSCICYRAFHTMGRELSYNGQPTNILYGFFAQLRDLHERFETSKIIFTFDFGRTLRKKDYPRYKSSRKKVKQEMPEVEKEQLRSMKAQILQLQTTYLKAIGYRNLFWQHGYEADDIIASICLHTLPKGDKAVIVTSDQDIYQLLSKDVSIFNPMNKKILTEEWFEKKYRISPTQWADVKAMAGCKTDDVKGIEGIGDIYACRFLGGTLGEKTAAFKKVIEGRKIWQRNLPLVLLPYEGTEYFYLNEDKTTNKKWSFVTGNLGMKSLMKERLFGE